MDPGSVPMVPEEEVKVCRDADGAAVKLEEGSFGVVCPALLPPKSRKSRDHTCVGSLAAIISDPALGSITHKLGTLMADWPRSQHVSRTSRAESSWRQAPLAWCAHQGFRLYTSETSICPQRLPGDARGPCNSQLLHHGPYVGLHMRLPWSTTGYAPCKQGSAHPTALRFLSHSSLQLPLAQQGVR